ncbi:MFS transporter [Enterovirga rhinocerotis]|uniref:Putative MFS family arabinose efflux permease n=1 Tax=Enterovirga rhinocerotis TaxID=1339210 RepID=A0A4R7BU94_9HYPH|nr:MFS transporter [Enterovirga rhinocerotis]TDR89320.1 putative MFS family arabinose efflux permease [Enterovirga rhinocerotis]
MIAGRLVWALGFSQLAMWGITFYMVAIVGEPIVRETGWSRTEVYGGFSAALVVMGVVSGRIGRLIDRIGGRPVMTAGSCIGAAGCLILAAAHHLAVYYLGWIVLGLAMRMTLYDAAFAALARVGGPEARRPIAQITLLGGLASTVLWPIGQFLIQEAGWRWTLVAYAGIALATIPLHLMIPAARYAFDPKPGAGTTAPRADTPARIAIAGFLYGTMVTFTSALNSAMSAHMIAILTSLGLAAGVAVGIGTLRGIGQSASRGAEILFGRRLDPIALGVLATAIMPVGFVIGLWSGASPAAGIAFALLYGAGNGLVTIVRGTQPLVLFDPAAYGQIVGRLIGPSFIVSALAPALLAFLIERYGPASALYVSTGAAMIVFASSLGLWLLFRRR